MYEHLKEYLNWYDTRRDTKFAADAPVIGLVMQRSHLVTGDEGHYSGVVSELEAQGAKVLHVFIACSCGTGLVVRYSDLPCLLQSSMHWHRMCFDDIALFCIIPVLALGL